MTATDRFDKPPNRYWDTILPASPSLAVTPPQSERHNKRFHPTVSFIQKVAFEEKLGKTHVKSHRELVEKFRSIIAEQSEINKQVGIRFYSAAPTDTLAQKADNLRGNRLFV